MDIRELVIYRNLKHQTLFEQMAGLMGMSEEKESTDSFACAGQLIELAAKYGFEGNLWHCFLALCLADNENAYTTACEVKGPAGGTLDLLAKEDFAIFKALFDFDLSSLAPSSLWSLLADYRPALQESRVFNRRIRDRIVELAKALEQASDLEGFQQTMVEFYRGYGAGTFGLNKAFRILEKEAGGLTVIDPIVNVEHIYFKDIVGYELQKHKLIENTEAFVNGKEANNVLLFGDAGTGKSSSVKAVLNEYYSRGLRMIEVYKHQFKDLSDVLEQIKDRNYKFIIYMDDLSFEEFEIEYKYLKAVIEGGLERKPDNILIYATSNRRHLVRERAGDKLEVGDSDDIHSSDTVQEKLSLVYRFGVRIYFGAPDRKEFHTIVKTLAARHGIQMPEDQLLAEAGKWEISHGGLTGRTAQQFIDHLLGKEEN